MPAAFRSVLAFAILVFASACDCGTPNVIHTDAGVDAGEPPDEIPPGDPGLVMAVPRSASYHIPTLRGPVQVVRTEMDVPHLYASNERDLRVVQGFIAAKERFFQLDIIRRYGLGEVADLLGTPGLALDELNRARGIRAIADRMEGLLSAPQRDLLDAYAEGINAYIDEVGRGSLPAPSEHNLALLLLRPGGRVTEVMRRFTRRDLLGFSVGVLFNTSFEDDDLRQGLAEESFAETFAGDPFASLRIAGAQRDMLDHTEPLIHIKSAPGLGISMGGALMASAHNFLPTRSMLASRTQHRASRIAAIPENMRQRLFAQMEDSTRMQGDLGAEFGSNAFALSSRGTANGAAIVASDSHLALTVAPIYLQEGLDTRVFGASDASAFTQFGLFFPGVMYMAEGTNGHVAWGNTFQEGDSTDFYREVIRLDAEGKPDATLFRGDYRGLERIAETYHVAGVMQFQSTERDETRDRYVTFDGRHIIQIEGQVLADGEEPPAGHIAVFVGGSRIVPSDTNHDGRIVAISIDTVMFDASNLMTTLEHMGLANDVSDFREALRSNVGFVENFTLADSAGHVAFSGYTALPCRGYLRPSGQTVGWGPGGNPQRIIDGTRYPAFAVTTRDGLPDETRSEPENCLVRFDQFPQVENPSEGFTLNANNDLAGQSFDGDLSNDAVYLGGPYDLSYRADELYQAMAAMVRDHNGSTDSMVALQASHRSRIAESFVPFLRQALQRAHALAAATQRNADEQRVVDLYQAQSAQEDQAMARLEAWLSRGASTSSGVTTFYDGTAAAEHDDAVASTIFHAWFVAFLRRVFGDEGLTDAWSWDPDAVMVNNLHRFLVGRGAGNSLSLSSYNPATAESIFFDQRNTPLVERSDEALVGALRDAMVNLAAAPSAPGIGGFASNDQNQWLWGLRHFVVLDSLVKTFAGSSLGSLDSLLSSLAISTRNVPLADAIPAGDPRANLPWFPRPGGLYTIDTGGFDMALAMSDDPATSQRMWTRTGAVMRQVIELDANGVRGRTILPGGVSGISNSPHFVDQARLWLGNQTLPLRFDVHQVTEGATSRERFLP